MLKYNRYAFRLNFNDEDIFFGIHNEGSTEQHTYITGFIYFAMYVYGRSACSKFKKAFVRKDKTSINGNLIDR